MKQKSVLIFIFFLFTLNAFSQKSEAEKVIWKANYSTTLKRALKHPLKTKYVFINNYTDSIFPNDDLLKLKNIEQIVLHAKYVLRKKKTDSLIEPVKIKIDTVKLKLLPKLKYLTRSHFDFRKFPVELCYLRNLKGLNISICLIDSLPNEIENLKNLQVLTMRLNYLSQLPNSIRNLDSLTLLDLSNNNFKEFPRVLCEIQNLKKVDMSNVECDKEVMIWHWSWPFPIHINKINYSMQIESLKKILMHPKFEKIRLQAETKEARLEVKKGISPDLYKKMAWRINANN